MQHAYCMHGYMLINYTIVRSNTRNVHPSVTPSAAPQLKPRLHPPEGI